MKTLLFLLIPFLMIGQVGIGTVTPQSSLDVDDTSMPFGLRVENVPPITSTRFVTLDPDNNFGWSSVPLSSAPSVNNVFNQAGTPILISSNTNGMFSEINIDLGMNYSLSVSPMTRTLLSITLSVQSTIQSNNNNVNASIGVSYIENGNLLTRRFMDVGNNTSITLYKTFNNNTSSSLIYTFRVVGDILQTSSTGGNTIYSIDRYINYQLTSFSL